MLPRVASDPGSTNPSASVSRGVGPKGVCYLVQLPILIFADGNSILLERQLEYWRQEGPLKVRVHMQDSAGVIMLCHPVMLTLGISLPPPTTLARHYAALMLEIHLGKKHLKIQTTEETVYRASSLIKLGSNLS